LEEEKKKHVGRTMIGVTLVYGGPCGAVDEAATGDTNALGGSE
jgi:hypothetical protein